MKIKSCIFLSSIVIRENIVATIVRVSTDLKMLEYQNYMKFIVIMKKSNLKLIGVHELSKNEQKNVNGGGVGTKCSGTNTAVCGVPPPNTVYTCVSGRCMLTLLD